MTQTAISVVALALALLTSLGSVYLSAGMKLAACPLCYYQRSFAFAVAAVLLVGLVFEVQEKVTLPALALPLALSGLSVAAYHVSLEARGKMECPTGATMVLTAPKESLLAFALLTLALGHGTLISELSGFCDARARVVSCDCCAPRHGATSDSTAAARTNVTDNM